MKLRNKVFVLLATAIMGSAAIPAMPCMAAGQTWQEAYLKTVYSYSEYNPQYFSCQLVYLDNDEIPELYIGDPFTSRCGGLYTYVNDASVCLMEFGFKDYFQAYTEKSGIFENYYYIQSAGAEVGISFYQLENGSLTLLDELYHDVVNDTYAINNVPADEESYNHKIAEYALESESETYTYEEMIAYLQAEINPQETTEVATEAETETEQTVTETDSTTASSEETSSTTASTTTAKAESSKKTSSPATGETGTAAVLTGGIALVIAMAALRRKSI